MVWNYYTKRLILTKKKQFIISLIRIDCNRGEYRYIFQMKNVSYW